MWAGEGCCIHVSHLVHSLPNGRPELSKAEAASLWGSSTAALATYLLTPSLYMVLLVSGSAPTLLSQKQEIDGQLWLANGAKALALLGDSEPQLH